MDASSAREYFWGTTLSEDKKSIEWTFEEEEEEDRDFFSHTLFLKSAVLGPNAKAGETSIIEVQTKDFEDKEVKQPLISLTAGQNNMCLLDVSFDHRVPVTFNLVAGSGPVSMSAQHLVEFPDESKEFGEETGTEQEDTEIDEEEVAALESSKKRKASAALKNGKSKRGKIDSTGGDDDDDDDAGDDDEEEDEEEDMSEDEEEDMSEDEEEDIESSPDVKKAKKKGNVAKPNTKAVKGKKDVKKGKASPHTKKAGKKARAK